MAIDEIHQMTERKFVRVELASPSYRAPPVAALKNAPSAHQCRIYRNCSSVISTKYVCDYMTKGSETAMFGFTTFRGQDEIADDLLSFGSPVRSLAVLRIICNVS